MKRIIAAIALSLISATVAAKSVPDYYCDAQVTDMHTGAKGAYIMDAGTLTAANDGSDIWYLDLNTDSGSNRSVFIAMNDPSKPLPKGYPAGATHFEDHEKNGIGTNTDYDFIVGSGKYKGEAILIVTPRDDSGNQMQLTCKDKK